MPKLIYGLAKFSNKNYGFGSRPKNFNKLNFLSFVSSYFNIFECADRYFKSSNYLSKLKNREIHFKIDKIPYDKNFNEILNFFLKKIEIYKKIQNKTKIKLLYIHENKLRIINNNKILKVLKFLKNKKIVKNFGASVYSEKELLSVLKKKIFNYIQIPINIADSYYFIKYKKKLKKKIIVARSIVLQGTLLAIKKKFKYKKELNEYIKSIDKICYENKISREEMLYRYIFSLKNLNYVLIGSINKNNIRKVMLYKNKKKLSKNIMNKCFEISKIKKNWTNPQKWN